MKNFIYYLYLSLRLDYALLLNPFFKRISVSDKTELIIKKYIYFLLIILGVKKVDFGKSYVKLFGKQLHISDFGLERFHISLVRQGEFLSIINTKKLTTIIDIGANIGNVSIAISRLFPKAKIYSFEPVIDIYRILEKTTRDYKNIYTFPLAISNNSSSLWMFYNQTVPEGSMVINESVNFHGKKFRVKALTLDQFLKQNDIKKVDYLKIDVESFEKNVLLGAGETLKNVHYLCLEIQAIELTTYTFSELVGMLYSKKYNFQLLKFHEYPTNLKKTFTLADCLFENIMFSPQ